MAATAIQSVQTGAQNVATQPVTPSGNLVPADVQAIVEALTPIQARFRQQSTFLKVTLAQASFALGQTVPTNISNVGLGIYMVTEWNVTITVANAATSAEVFSVSPLFPHNLIANTSVNINGAAAVYSTGGLGDLATYTRQRRRARYLMSYGAYSGATTSMYGPQLDLSLLRITKGSSLTITNAVTYGLNGIASISVAGSASSNNTLTVVFYTVEKLALDKDSLLGALPLQNNATYAQINRTIVGSLATTRNDLSVPFFTAGADLTFTLTTCTADTTYVLASVPPDPALYQSMISNSFQVQEQTALTVASTGAKALSYNIPQNLLLLASHILIRDTNGVALPGYNTTTGLGDLYLQYNGGTVTPVVQKAGRQRAEDFLDYNWDETMIPGYRLWDGENSTDDITSSDNMMWLDTLSVANPQINVDVGSSASTTLTYNIVREAVVPGAVQVIGG